MKKINFISLASLLFISLFSCFGSEDKIPDKPVETSLGVLITDEEVILALSYRNAPHWHTYWKNPGDAGLPTKIEAKNFEIQEYEWPVPTRYFEKGDILAYGYEGEYTRFFKVTKTTGGGTYQLHSNWLVCKHICIPGKVDISFDFDGSTLSQITPQDFEVSQDDLSERFHKLPKKVSWPNDLDLVLAKDQGENKLALYYNLSNPTDQLPLETLSMLTPFRQDLVEIQREYLYYNKDHTLFGKMRIGWDGEYMDPPQELPPDGKFQNPLILTFLFQDPRSATFGIIEKSFSNFEPKTKPVMEDMLKTLQYLAPGNNKNKEDEKPQNVIEDPSISSVNEEGQSSTSFLGFLLFAFLGGLILNIMPCVLPVISLKLFGLIVHSDESNKSIFRHNLFYTLGVLTTFFLLGIAIILFKATGENVGWGFQLQSPLFVALMILVLFIFSLNLFGLFEFSTPGGKTLGNVELKKGVVGDFFGGVLATILSTPCSAPFLGTALTFAFTSSNLSILLIFQAIGLGLAFPFLLTGIFPASIRFLPKPGFWMENVKKFLGLTLLLTLLWLIDVFVSLTDGNLPLMKLNTILLLTFFAFYLKKHMSRNRLIQALFFLLPLLVAFSFVFGPLQSQEKTTGVESDLLKEKNQAGKVYWEIWSEEKMKALAQQKELVFIDFTAKWCFTCKVNEKLVLETQSFQKLVQDHNIKLLLGDWTKYDPIIGDFLKKNGHVGVPAYFLQKPDGTLIKLGETITLSKIRTYLN